MLRHSWILLALAMVGCEAKPVVKPPAAPNNRALVKQMPADPTAPPAKPSPKPDPMKPPQTFTPSEDKELVAMKDVSVADLIGKLSAPKERDLAGRALVSRGKEAVDPLVEALAAEDAQVRAAAAFVLGQLGEDAEPATAKLKKMSQDDQNDVARDAATFALDALAEKPE